MRVASLNRAKEDDMAPMKLEIITAERVVYSDDVDVLVAPGVEGELGAATVIGCAANLKRPSIQEQPLARGDRIRVSTSKVVVGTFDSLEADTLFLENQITLPLSSVTKLEVSRGKKRSAGRAVGFGFLGILGGALVGAAIDETSRDCAQQRAEFDTDECDYGEVVVGAGAGDPGERRAGPRTT